MQQFDDKTNHHTFSHSPKMQSTIKTIVTTVMILLSSQALASDAIADEIAFDLQSIDQTADTSDAFWMLSTRHLPTRVCCASIDSVDFHVSKLDRCGNRQSEQFDTFLSTLSPDRTVVIHVHGNRLTELESSQRGRFVYRYIKPYIHEMPIDVVVFSWPAEQRGLLIRDGREKAEITETQGLYLATLLRELSARNIPVVLLAYSFGCRVVSGGLHCLAGGNLSGSRLSTEPIVGANIAVGMVAPAVPADWLGSGCYHGLASKNISRLTVLYNSRDAVLKRYWLIERGGHSPALGYAGPTRIAPGADGSPIPVVKCDCATFLGLAHNEVEYYTDGCNAGSKMATLILNRNR